MVYQVRLVLAAFLFALSASAQITQQATTGIPSPQLSGTGAPSSLYACNVALGNISFIQTDATNGRLWLCDQSSGSWAWDHLLAPTATGVTSAIGGTSIVGLGCATGTVTIAAAVSGTNAAIAEPLGDPGLISSLVPPLITAKIGAGGVVTVSVCNIVGAASFTPTALTYKVLIY